jgi:hypothetical protein
MIQQGEWLFAVYDESHAFPRRTLEGDAEVCAFSTVNGLSRFARLRFIGIAATVNESNRDNKDDRSAAIISGSSTGLNTGPEVIPQFALVCFSSVPFTAPRGTKGTMPAIQEDGIPMDKHRLPTYAMRDSDVYTSCLRMSRYVRSQWTESVITYDLAKTAFDNGKRVIIDESRKAGIPHTGTGEMLPVVAYGHWVNIQQFTSRIALAGATTTQLSTFVACIHDVIEDCRRSTETKDHEEAKFGRVATQSSGMIHKMRSLIDEIKSDESKTGTAATGTPKFALFIITHVIGWIEENLLKYALEQSNWQKRHIMGVALNTSAPGKALHLMMGYYHS